MFKKNIKNLKISNIKNKKYSLVKKAVIGVVIAGLSMAMISGCTTDKNYNKLNGNAQSIVTEVETPTESIILKKSSDYANERYTEENISTTIEYNDTALNYFSNFISDYDVDITYSDAFNYDEATRIMGGELSEIKSHTYSGFIKDGKIDEAALLESVKEKSPIFKKEGSHYMYTLITKDEEYKRIIAYIAEMLNKNLSTKTEAELAELDCVLGELTIFYDSGVSSARVTTENALIVNPTMINAMEITTGNDESYRNIIYHEASHLEQVSCIDHEHDLYNQQGVSRTTEEIEVNPYNWNWFTEGTAEKRAVDETGDEPTTYKYLVGYVEVLDYISLFSPNSEDNLDIAKVNSNRDTEKFYELLGVNNGISKEEIVKMMYCMEIMQGRVDNFEEIYENYYGKEFEDDFSELKQKYRTEFLLQASKIFYNNLAYKIHDKSVTLEDLNYIITTWEAILSYHTSYGTSNALNQELIQEFLKEYQNIQDEFFTSITLCNDISVSELYQYLNDYCMYKQDKNGTVEVNANLSFLTTSQQERIQNKINGSRIEFTLPINSVVELLSRTNNKQ